MTPKLFFSVFMSCFLASTAFAADTGIDLIQKRHYVVCGVNRDYNILAYRQEKKWTGFEADICRAVAAAVIGDAESFKLLPVAKENIGRALNSGQIDIMLGHYSLSPKEEQEQFVLPVDTLYIDKVIFASRTETSAQSMREFAGNRVCVLRNSSPSAFLEAYNAEHALEFKILELPTSASLKEAFYLRRCELVSGDEIFIKNITDNLTSSDKAVLLPEVIGYIPVKAYSSAQNPRFNMALYWILNALKFADNEGITSQNIEIFKSTKNKAVQNLFGFSPALWQSLELHHDWVFNFIKSYGNYTQLIAKGMGSLSPLKLDMKRNEMIKNGGLLSAVPFI